MDTYALLKIDYSSFNPEEDMRFEETYLEDLSKEDADEYMKGFGLDWKRETEELQREVNAFILNECFQAKDEKTGRDIYWIPLDADGFIGPFMRHYGLFGNLAIPLPEYLLKRQENELPYVYKDELDAWIHYISSGEPKTESPVRRDDTALRVVKNYKVKEKEWQREVER